MNISNIPKSMLWRLYLLWGNSFTRQYLRTKDKLVVILTSGKQRESWCLHEIQGSRHLRFLFRLGSLKLISPDCNFREPKFVEEFRRAFVRTISECMLTNDYAHQLAPIGTGDVIVDVGGSIGAFTIWASSMIGDDGHVYVFEPAPKSFSALTENIRINNVTGVSALQMGLGNKTKDVSLWCYPYFLANRIVPMSHKEAERVSIKMVTLDSFVASSGINRIDFIKIDVEGYEIETLYGAMEVINKLKPKLAIAWYHGRDDHDHILQTLREANSGYRFLPTATMLWAY